MFLFNKKKNKNRNKVSLFFQYFGIFSFFIFICLALYIFPFFKYGIETMYLNKNNENLNKQLFVAETFSEKIFYKIAGPPYFSVNNFTKALDFSKKFIITNLFSDVKLDTLELIINYKNLEILENQRKHKKVNSTNNEWARGKLVFRSNNKKKNINIKLRSKGDRDIHRLNLKEMSFKIDIIGNKRIYGIEEFSLQKPIIRNYSLEIIASKIMLDNDILAPKTIPVKVILNGENIGVYHIEESFSKEILETNRRKNGPIFGIEDTVSDFFPNSTYSLYSEKFWKENDPELIKSAMSKLEYIQNNYDKKNFNLFLYFDEEKWATFFALSDILASHHGSKADAVKYFYNPSSGKFEPIFFDGHINNGTSKINIILADFLKKNPQNYDKLGYLANYDNWYKLFFNISNKNFINLYFKNLNEFTSKEFQEKIYRIIEELDYVNNIYYANFMPADGVFSKSILPFYLDKDFFFKRANYIKKRVNSVFIDGKLTSIIKPYSFESEDKINNNSFFDKKIINLKNDIYYLKNINLINKEIIFNKPSTLILHGNNQINNSTFYGKGMIVQKNGNLHINESNFFGLSSIDFNSVNWSGAINIINSKLFLDNVLISNNFSEDAINIVNSKGEIKNILIENSPSDAIDVDFSEIKFGTINCSNIGNDCLDVSGSIIKGKEIKANFVNDKVISAGEFSNLIIKNFISSNSEIGIFSKDASIVIIENANFIKTKLYGAVFKKKQMYPGTAKLIIKNQQSIQDKFLHTFLVSKNSNLEINGKRIYSNISSKNIESMMYGNLYGTKTNK